MYNPKDIINTVAGNVRKTRSPFGIPKFMGNRWWKGADVKREGDALLFTGLMYQLVPYIEKSTSYLQRFEDTNWADYLQYARFFPKYLSGIGLALMTPGKGKREADTTLKNVVKILNKSNVDFKYRPELDNYSGILLYDLGDQTSFVEHAKFVAEKLQRAGIRKIITVDPHTTYALKVLYPKYTGINFEVKTYFELAKLSGGNGKQRVTLHDPCFYGRYLSLSDVPRQVLANVNIECV
ncbi:MAG: (Fe-S)-binding protein, partial [Deltaproteobacteria bacterium]|nr:(Fe-S)-binding protein [Deltaproteobacteria bacterium]